MVRTFVAGKVFVLVREQGFWNKELSIPLWAVSSLNSLTRDGMLTRYTFSGSGAGVLARAYVSFHLHVPGSDHSSDFIRIRIGIVRESRYPKRWLRNR